MTRPRLLAVAVMASAALAATGCGKKKDDATGSPRTQRLDLVLDYQPNPDHVGIYTAQSEGDFRRAGLDVQLQTPSDPALPLKLVQSGKADLAISYEPELLLARDKGAPLVAVAALAQRPLTSLMSLDDRVKSPSDLAGKTVGTAGIPYQSAYLKTILERAGVDTGTVREANVGFNLVPAMTSKRVDATLGAFWNIEGVALQRAKKKPKIIRADQAGVPTYDELVVVAREGYLRDHGELVRRFVQALSAGTTSARRDPAAATKALISANRTLDPGDTAAQVKATLPALLPSGSQPFGAMSSPQWEAYSRWMLKNGLVERLPLSAAKTDEFLPGQGARSDDPDQPGSDN